MIRRTVAKINGPLPDISVMPRAVRIEGAFDIAFNSIQRALYSDQVSEAKQAMRDTTTYERMVGSACRQDLIIYPDRTGVPESTDRHLALAAMLMNASERLFRLREGGSYSRDPDQIITLEILTTGYRDVHTQYWNLAELGLGFIHANKKDEFTAGLTYIRDHYRTGKRAHP